MIAVKLVYAALTVVAVLFYILYRGTLSLTLLLFALLLPPLLWLFLQRLRRGVSVRLYHKGIVQSGEPFHWIVEIRNRSLGSSAHARLLLEYGTSFSGQPQPLTLYIPVMPDNVQRIRLTFHSTACGVMRLRLRELVLYDPLRLFKAVIRLKQTDPVVVLPPQNLLFREHWDPCPQVDTDTAEYSREKAGDDPSEIFDLHEYREGDPISRIHWKLSTKHDTLMVKEYSLPLSAGYLLLPDYRLTAAQPEGALRLDAMLSALYAAGIRLGEKGLSFRAGAYSTARGMELTSLLHDRSSLQEWLEMLLHIPPEAATAEPGFLQEIVSLMDGSRSADKLLLFTPRLDRAMIRTLAGLHCAKQITVFAVNMNPNDLRRITGAEYPFECIPVTPERLPEREPLPMTDFDTAQQEDFTDAERGTQKEAKSHTKGGSTGT